uniref:M96 mating-specific protein family n=1 Tax=Globisporangium ultimum (strain ATCC 200006 / CBS 805.95 / DAOM BR144) TaxID=431595 RepID=K3W9J0_GLOUD
MEIQATPQRSRRTRDDADAWVLPASPDAAADFASLTAEPAWAPADAIDESSLLAETEELLANLDATAFTAPPTPPAYSGADHPPERALRVISPGAAHADTLEAKPHLNKRRPSRDKAKHELVALRLAAADLEKQLMTLREGHDSKKMTGRENKAIGKLWQQLAERQMKAAQRAEIENKQLKAMLSSRFSAHDPFTSDKMLLALPNYAHGKARQRPILEDKEALASASLFEALIARLDVAYTEVDAVFREIGLPSTLETQTYSQSRPRSACSDSPCVEFTKVRAFPFELQFVQTFFWEELKNWHYKDDPFTYPCRDRADDTFAVSYRVENSLNDEQRSFRLCIVMRRYFEADRFVVVWAARSDSDNALANLYTQETGWIRLSGDVPPGIVVSASPLTCFQATIRVVPKRENEAAATSPKAANELAQLVLKCFVEDATLVNQMVENALLKNARASARGELKATLIAAADERITFGATGPTSNTN